MRGREDWLWIQPPENWEELCTWKACFKKYSPFMPASGRYIFPCCLELTCMLVSFLWPAPGVNTLAGPGATLLLCNLGLPGFSSGPASLMSWLLSGNTAGLSLKSVTGRQALLVCKYILLCVQGSCARLTACLLQFREMHYSDWSSLCFSSQSRLLRQ